MAGENIYSIDLTESECEILLMETAWWASDDPYRDATCEAMRRIRLKIENELAERRLNE